MGQSMDAANTEQLKRTLPWFAQTALLSSSRRPTQPEHRPDAKIRELSPLVLLFWTHPSRSNLISYVIFRQAPSTSHHIGYRLNLARRASQTTLHSNGSNRHSFRKNSFRSASSHPAISINRVMSFSPAATNRSTRHSKASSMVRKNRRTSLCSVAM